MSKTYQDDDGARVFVSPGISNDEVWMSVREKDRAGTHRVKSPALPLQSAREDAQADLDIYAAIRGWREVRQL